MPRPLSFEKGTARLLTSALFAAFWLANCCWAAASQQVAHVVTEEDLKQALLDSSVVHVVLTQHLDLSASTASPFKVHGVQKTIRGGCHQPSDRLLRDNRGDGQDAGSPDWKYLQCIISVPHSLFDIESEGERSNVWISDVYILAEGVQDDVVQADNAALVHADSADVWASGVSIVAAGSGSNRALSLKDSSIFLGGCLFHGLKLETPSPVLLLDTGTAYFSDAVFSSIKGPPACGAMHVYAGAVALQDSGWSGTDASVEHDICLADVSSRVYADSSVGVTNLEGELGEDSGTLELEESAHHYPRFLRASDSKLLQLIKSQVTETAMLWPTSVTRSTAEVSSKGVKAQRVTLVIVACAVAAVISLLAALLLLLLHRLRARRLRDTPSKVSGTMAGSTPTATPTSAMTKALESKSGVQKTSESSGGVLVGVATDPTGTLASGHAESFVQVDSFLTQPPASGSFLSQGRVSSEDGVHVRQSQTCPIHDGVGPTGLFNSSHVNTCGRGLIRSTSAGSCSHGSNLQTPRRKLARWNSLPRLQAEELDLSDKLKSRGTLHCSRPMASLQEEAPASDTSETLTLGNKQYMYPPFLERDTLSSGGKSPGTGGNFMPANAPSALKPVDVSEYASERLTDSTDSTRAADGAVEPQPVSPPASYDVTEVLSTTVKLPGSTDTRDVDVQVDALFAW